MPSLLSTLLSVFTVSGTASDHSLPERAASHRHHPITATCPGRLQCHPGGQDKWTCHPPGVGTRAQAWLSGSAGLPSGRQAAHLRGLCPVEVLLFMFGKCIQGSSQKHLQSSCLIATL